MSSLDQIVRNDISTVEMEKHLQYLGSFERTAGTEGEFRAVQYVADQLKGWGVPVTIYEFEAYLSYPLAAVLEVLSPTRQEIKAKTRAFSGATPPEGVVGEIIYVPGGADMFRDFETITRLQNMQLQGKIVLSEGGGRQNMIAAQRLGAVGYIHMWPSEEEQLHEGIVSPVWGTPTIETINRLPDLPVITVNHASGQWLRQQAEAGPVKVRLFTKVDTAWRRQLLPVADIPGRTPRFVLAGGHIDSWHLGATDNATGNVTCLELARVFWKHRSQLERGVRIAWWTGHSTGRYAGSTWYADHAWQDLHDNCVAYINIDSPGPLGATDYSQITAMAENAHFACGLVSELTGQQVHWERPERAGDQSFWGHGITSIFMLLSNRPEGQRAKVGGSGMGWWWHTEWDTLDKVDMKVLLLDTQIHATAIARLATSPILPYRMADLATELEGLLTDMTTKAQDHLDMSTAVHAAGAFTSVARRFDTAVQAIGNATGKQNTANEAMLAVMRLIIPVNYTASGPFEHDPAVPLRPLPGLARLPELPRLVGKPEYGFLKTYLVRQYNRVVHALTSSTRVLEKALAELQ